MTKLYVEETSELGYCPAIS